MGKTPLPGLLAPLAGNESAMGTRVYLPRILCAILGSTTEVDSTAKAVRILVESHRTSPCGAQRCREIGGRP